MFGSLAATARNIAAKSVFRKCGVLDASKKNSLLMEMENWVWVHFFLQSTFLKIQKKTKIFLTSKMFILNYNLMQTSKTVLKGQES